METADARAFDGKNSYIGITFIDSFLSADGDPVFILVQETI